MKKCDSFSRNWMLALAVVGTAPLAMAVDINDEAGLRSIANDLSGEYTLTADITLTSDWTPIGSDNDPFTGKINGNGHLIKGLRVQTQDVARAAFINSAQGATITKLGLDDVDILGNEDVGGLIGKDKGYNTISECFVSGKVSGRDHVGALIGGCTDEGLSTLENCYALAYVYSREYQGGGLIGTPIDIDVNNSYFAGSVFSASNCIGGIAALVDGGDHFTVSNCFEAAPLLLRNTISWGAQGRILGTDSDKGKELTNNYALASTRIGSYAENTTIDSDDATSNDGANKTLAELTDPNFIASTLGWDGTVWSSAANVLPHLAWQTEPVTVDAIYADYVGEKASMKIDTTVYMGQGVLPGATYTSSDTSVATVDNEGNVTGISNGTTTITVSVPANATHKAMSKSFEVEVVGVVYNITTAAQLNAMRFDLAGDFTLMNDIDMADFGAFTPIGSDSDGNRFTGSFNGNGHVIKNLTIESAGDDLGFFGVADGATITKVGFENANVLWDTTSGGANVAVVVGRSYGSTITNSYVSGSFVRGRDHVASFVGGSFTGGSSDTYTTVEDCYSTSYIYSTQYQCGGIMGTMVNALINRCHFSGVASCSNSNVGGMLSLVDGEAEMTTISNSICLAATIDGSSDNSGRIVGNTAGRATTLENNYGLEETACAGSDNADNATTGGVQGESVSLEQATDASFYADALGWDMESTWQMIDGGYPILKWQTKPVNGSFLNLPTSITLIEGKGDYNLGDIKGDLGQDFNVEEVETNYLRIRASISVKTWPATTTTTTVRFTSTFDDVACTVDVPVTMVPESESKVHIASAADVLAMNDHLDYEYILDKDINMEGVSFSGIGSEDAPFTGVLDGNGYSIVNITRPVSGNKKGGLFNVTQGATIKNLGICDVEITGGSQDIAGLIGSATLTKVSQVYVTGYIQGNDHVGGIFGNAISSTIDNSYVNASVITTGYQVGGISGVAKGLEITNTYAAGESKTNGGTSWSQRAAGIIGMTEGSGSSMNGVGSFNEIAGGIIGIFLGTADNWDCILSSFTKCIYSNSTSRIPGDACDDQGSYDYEGRTTIDDNGHDWSTVPRVSASDARTDEQLASWATYSALGWLSDVWSMPEDGGYPVLNDVAVSGIKPVIASKGSDVKVYGAKGAIVVDAASAANVNIYNFAGATVGQHKLAGATTIETPAGLYIVSVKSADGVKVVKVVVR